MQPQSHNPSIPQLPDPAPGLNLVKASVRSQSAYTLDAPRADRKLNQNESPYDFPDDLKRQVLERMALMPWQRYPDFAPQSLLADLARHADWVPEGILVGNGSNELIQASLAVALDAGDRVVAPTPTFSLYRLLTAVSGGFYIPVPLGGGFEYDVDAIITAARCDHAKVVVLNSPNNPTGSALPEGAVARVLAATDALVICDEAYQDFGGPSALGLLKESSRVVVLRTFSKAMGMAGLRFGYALAHPTVAREIAKAKLPYNVNSFTLAAASVALANRGRLAERTRQIVDERERLLGRLRTIHGIRVYPSAANFVLIRCTARPAREIFQRLHAEYGILVRDVSSGAGLAECLRISVGTAEDTEAVVAALQATLNQ